MFATSLRTLRHRAAALRGFARAEQGAATVEFAIVSAVLMVVLMGMIEYGVLSFRRNNAAEAARFGARMMMVRGSQSGRALTEAQLRDTLRARLAVPNLSVTLTYPDASPSTAPGKRVRVTVAYPAGSVITGLFPSVTIQGKAESIIVY